ncbi:MAG: MlaD family protein [Syntrophorhabdaceae bacterium]|nr:MlaD family protein [Syntrophorhabdaceae bacterium]
MKKYIFSSEIKVGVLILVGIGILFYMSLRVGTGIFKEKGYEIFVQVKNASGLDIKTPVFISGIEIGKVKRIALKEYKATITLNIKEGINIPSDSKVAVNSQGVLGDKFIEIIPGKSKVYLPQGGVIEHAIQAPDFNEIFTYVSIAAKNFGETMSELKGIVGDKEKANIKKGLENIQSASSDFGELIKENRTGIKNIVNNADEAITGFKNMVKEVEAGKGTFGLLLKDDRLYSETKDAVGILKNLASDIEQGKGTLGKLVKDDEIYAGLKETVDNMKTITDDIKKGEGSLGKLVKDDKLYKETEQMVKKVQRAADGITEMTPITILGTILGFLF